MTLAERQPDLFDPVDRFCGEQVADDSVYTLLHRERDRLFPDEMFADLCEDVGRRSKPLAVLAVLLVLQRLSHLNDREAVDGFTFEARFRYACGSPAWCRWATRCGAVSELIGALVGDGLAVLGWSKSACWTQDSQGGPAVGGGDRSARHAG